MSKTLLKTNFLLTVDGEQMLTNVGNYLIYLGGLIHEHKGKLSAEVDCNGLLVISYANHGVRHIHEVDADRWVVDKFIDMLAK